MRTWLILAVLWLAALAVSPAHAQMDAGNAVGQLLASQSYTATTVATNDQTNASYHGLTLVINVSAYTSGTYTPVIQGKDPVSGAYFTLLTGPAIGATGTTVLTVYPGITATANSSAATILPQTWRLILNGATTPVMTLNATALLQQ